MADDPVLYDEAADGRTWRLVHGDVCTVADDLASGSVDVVVTSPPYAEQRADQYGGIPEGDYPEWTVSWFDAIAPALTDRASIFVNIREHLRDGEISDYVLHTRLALRAAGWVECEELIWFKSDGPPLGSPARPRRSWERVLWFAPTPDPWCDPTNVGKYSEKVGLSGGGRGTGEYVGVASQTTQPKGQGGRARGRDIIEAPVSGIDRRKWLDHPAMYPVDVPKYCVNLACPPGADATVLDVFNGAATTGVAALELGRSYVGIDRDERYIAMSSRRLTETLDAGQLF